MHCLSCQIAQTRQLVLCRLPRLMCRDEKRKGRHVSAQRCAARTHCLHKRGATPAEGVKDGARVGEGAKKVLRRDGLHTCWVAVKAQCQRFVPLWCPWEAEGPLGV